MYRWKHIPTGFYYQPRKHGQSHLGTNGKIYSKESYAKAAIFSERDTTHIWAASKNRVYQKTKDSLAWVESRVKGNYFCITSKSEWELEKIEHEPVTSALSTLPEFTAMKIMLDINSGFAGFSSNIDISDIGNSIGMSIGEHIVNLGLDKDDFIKGIQHGISVKDGTH